MEGDRNVLLFVDRPRRAVMSGAEAFFGLLGAVLILAICIGGTAWISTLVPVAWILTVFACGVLVTILALGFYFVWLAEVL